MSLHLPYDYICIFTVTHSYNWFLVTTSWILYIRHSKSDGRLYETYVWIFRIIQLVSLCDRDHGSLYLWETCHYRTGFKTAKIVDCGEQSRTLCPFNPGCCGRNTLVRTSNLSVQEVIELEEKQEHEERQTWR